MIKQKTFRIVGMLALILALAGLMACNSEETVTLQSEQNGVIMKITYVAEGDEVIEQSTESEIPYSSLMVTTKEEAQAILDPIVAEIQGTEGLEHNIDYQDDKAIETMTIDYTTADLSEISALPGSTFEGEEGADTVSLEQSVEMMEGQGFEVVE
ncbi:YehR family lipoprotein [Oceanobacillus oncorhynchi]|uniref:YehR family lipoprotein n=1 Tax=Oceanobacillus oncorhynchi TaxID=545501 RepID=UPI0021169475|nr:YehR family protein [Oceanobacillus oncorhynchi]UUI39482.1 YehR family protein [Oceanobacillus oncorhynchi]